MTKASLFAAFAFLTFVAAPRPIPAQTGTIHILSSGALEGLLEKIQPACESAMGQKLDIQFDTTAALAKRIAAGDPFDAIVGSSDGLDALSKAGALVGARPEFARVGTGIGARTGEPTPDVSTPDALKRALLAAKSVTYAPTGASTAVIRKAFDQLGIADQMKTKSDLLANGALTTASVLAGKNQYVITTVSEIRSVKGLELVGPFPETLQEYITFAVGVGARFQNPAAARLAQCFDQPGIATALESAGLEPIPPKP